mgnify:CR=1 FL=1
MLLFDFIVLNTLNDAFFSDTKLFAILITHIIKIFISTTRHIHQQLGRSEALISIVDLHRTLIEVAGGTFQSEDSISFLPQLVDPQAPGARQWLFAEKNNDSTGQGQTGPGHERAISDGRWKLLRNNFGDELYDLSVDLVEGNNLLGAPLSGEAQAAYDSLQLALQGFL